MGRQPHRERFMNTHRSLVEFAGRLLEAQDREVVLGDLLEAGESGSRALLEIAGLAVRRQAELWKTFHPWLAGLLALSSSYLLTGVSGSVSCTYERLRHPGNFVPHWPTGQEGLWLLLCHIFLLIAWAWTAGFVVGSASRRTVWASAMLCLLPFFVAAFHIEPLPKFCLLLFVLPASLGIRHGLRGIRIEPFLAFALAIIVTVLTTLAWTSNALWIPNWALILPAWYLVVMASRSSQEGRTGSWPTDLTTYSRAS
jgi:hypothetical protein